MFTDRVPALNSTSAHRLLTILTGSCLLSFVLSAATETHQPKAFGADIFAGKTEGAPVDLGTVHFQSRQATLSPEGTATLQHAITALKKNPDKRLRFEGYVKTSPEAPVHGSLAQQRSSTVERYLQQDGVSLDRVTGAGFYYAKPNAGHSGHSKALELSRQADFRAENRRLELF